jgi:4-amino-4-deoxy-L-arabinose transferase-like glycosyltransferase
MILVIGPAAKSVLTFASVETYSLEIMKDLSDSSTRCSRWATCLDLSLIGALLALLIAIRATAPANTYAYAQHWNVGISFDVAENNHWLAMYDQAGKPARKPQLYYWLSGAVLRVTGPGNEFAFRLVTVLASFGTVGLVYGLGRRWYNRRAALMAGLLWVAILQMFRLSYCATTDMLLTFWMTAALGCIDRVLWHPGRRRFRWMWLTGFYASMILAAMSKGLGIINWPVMMLFVAIASACWPGFYVVRIARGAGKLGMLARAIGRRWWRAMCRAQLLWGVLAFVAVMAPLLIATRLQAGEAFDRTFAFEIVDRFIGSNAESAPDPSTVPAVVNLIYYAFPATLCAFGALALTKPSRWLTHGSPTLLPLAWTIALVVPFSISHGFRPDYLLPCYGTVALMGGWAIDRLGKLSPELKLPSLVRHSIAAGGLVVAMALMGLAIAFLWIDLMPEWMDLEAPAALSTVKRVGLGLMIPAGMVAFWLTVRWSLRWRIAPMVAVMCVAMMGVHFVEGNCLSRHARTGDGDKMIAFAREAAPLIGQEAFVSIRADKLGVELYVGRFSQVLCYDPEGPSLLDQLNASDVPLLVITDRGLVSLGAATEFEQGEFLAKVDGVKRRFNTHPEQLGEVLCAGEPIAQQYWGRPYLIRLFGRPLDVSGDPVETDFVSGELDE